MKYLYFIIEQMIIKFYIFLLNTDQCCIIIYIKKIFFFFCFFIYLVINEIHQFQLYSLIIPFFFQFKSNATKVFFLINKTYIIRYNIVLYYLFMY